MWPHTMCGEGQGRKPSYTGLWGVLTCPLTAKFVFNVVSLSGEEFDKLILVFLHNALTLPTKKTKS